MRHPLEGRAVRTRRRVPRLAALAVALICAVALPLGCGDDGSAPDSAAQPKADPMQATVAMTFSGYSPDEVVVPQGGTVTWVNAGFPRATAENWFDEPFHFDIHTLYPGQTKSVRFKRPGRYEYQSSYDPGLFDGVIVVKPRGSGGGS